MRIAVNTRFLLKGRLEGVGRFTLEVLRELVERQTADEFIFFFDRAYDPEFVFAENITPVVLSPPARHPILFTIWFEWSVARALKQYRADVFFSPDNFCSLRTSVPTILVVHDLAYLHFPNQVSRIQLAYYRYFMPRFVQKADSVVTVSEFTKQDLSNQFATSNTKIKVACNGVRSAFEPLSELEKAKVQAKYAQGDPYFFYVGAVHPRKNIPRLIAAFDQFKTDTKYDVQLLIAGRFSWKTGEVSEAYAAATHQAAIHFLGYVSDEELPQLVGAALALTYISLFEGFGVPLLEAMACEVPVLTSNVSSMPEVIGDAGLLVDPTDVTAIADAMERLAQDEPLRKRLVNKARKQRQKFSWSVAARVLQQEILYLNKTKKITQ
ncbi:MAG: glycosyltransferase family 1 protein [Bacteroidota bacterium]